jgi:hypothetical protein
MQVAKSPLFIIERNLPRKMFSTESVVVILWLAILVAAAIVTPDPRGHGTHTQLGLPPCFMMTVLHRPCPACGLTTSFANVMHGDIASAFSAHPLGPAVILYFAIAAVYSLSKLLFGFRIILPPRFTLLANATLLAAFMAFGICRFFA